MRYKLQITRQFARQLKLMKKRQMDVSRLETVVDSLANGGMLDAKYRNHKLVGDYQGCYECHIAPDWLLVYRKNDDSLILVLVDTGSHSDLFGK